MSETLGESAAERILHAAERRFEKGRREGKREGQRATLLRMLRVRFGDLPEAAVARVQSARSKELDEMAERFAKALPLDEILAKG